MRSIIIQVLLIMRATCFRFNQRTSFVQFTTISSSSRLKSMVQDDQTLVSCQARDPMAYHRERMLELLYPPGSSLKQRQHLVHEHPIYNFIHTYYRYSVDELLIYRPLALDGDRLVLSNKNRQRLADNLAIIEATARRPAFVGCYGLHEWAMMLDHFNHHQRHLPCRVSQETIRHVLDSYPLRCAHFDAVRFFPPSLIQRNYLNINQEQSQSSQPKQQQASGKVALQLQYEQGGCVHANMDLFKYSYELYRTAADKTYLASHLLHRALVIAHIARNIDMRASPYDVSAYDLDTLHHLRHTATQLQQPLEVEEIDQLLPLQLPSGPHLQQPICLETATGRQQYVAEQQSLAEQAAPFRQELILAYRRALLV